MVDTAGIQVENISFGIGEFTLQNVVLIVPKGKYFVLTGPNGAGKSVLLKLISGLYKPTSGAIAISGCTITALPPWKRQVGYVPQEGTLFPHRTVERNIAFSLEVRNVPRDEIRDKVAEIMKLLNIGHLAKRQPQGLSGGERQKVSLARALIFRPDVLLLDEPVSAIDEESRDTLCQELKRIQTEFGVTTLHVSHNSRETKLVADSIACLRNGVITTSVI